MAKESTVAMTTTSNGNGIVTLKWALAIFISLFTAAILGAWTVIGATNQTLSETNAKVAVNSARHEEMLRRCDSLEKGQGDIYKELRDMNRKMDELLLKK